MKTVINKTEKKDVVDVCNIDSSKDYAFQYKTSDGTWFGVIIFNYTTGLFKAHCLRGFTHGNAYSQFDNKILSKMISEMIDRGFDVKEFDTPREMIGWLNEQMMNV